MAYKVIDASKKLEAVKKYWADGNISQISRETGASRATIYSWIALAGEALQEAFEQTRPGPRIKSLQEENAALKEELRKLYNDYHRLSRRGAASTRDDTPRVCPGCGSGQIRKNGTIPSERQGTRQRYSCRQCSLSIYVMFKKKDLTGELHVCVTKTEVMVAEVEPAVESPPAETKISEAHTAVHCVTVETFQWVPSGFLCLLADFADALGLFKVIEDVIHLPMKEVQYTHLDKIKTLLAMIVLGCKHIHDINHRLRPYPIMAQRLGMEKFPEQSQISRFLHSFAGQLFQLDDLFETLLRTYGLWQQQEKVNLDFDCTGLVVYGDTFELCRKGYFARHPGSKGYQLSLISTFGYEAREIMSLHLDPGNSHPNARFWDGIFQAAEICGLDRIGVVRADAAQGSGPNIEELIELGFGFTIKGYSVLTARNFARQVVHEQWDEIDLFTRVADLGLQKIHKCCYPVRTILVETLNTRGRIDYFNLYTHFQPELMSGPEVFHYYNGRQTIEALIKGEKHSLQIIPMKTRSFAGNYAFLYFAAIVFNLLAWFKHYILKATDLKHLGLDDLTSKLMQIPAQIQYNNNQLELAFPSQHPLIKQLARPPATG